MRRRYSVYISAILAALMLSLAPGVETVLCLCIDHMSAQTTVTADACCAGENQPSTTYRTLQADIPGDCGDCIDLVLPAQQLPLLQADPPQSPRLPELLIARVFLQPAENAGLAHENYTRTLHPSPITPICAGDLLRI